MNVMNNVVNNVFLYNQELQKIYTGKVAESQITADFSETLNSTVLNTSKVNETTKEVAVIKKEIPEPNISLKWYGSMPDIIRSGKIKQYMEERRKIIQAPGVVAVPFGVGEMPQFMEELQKAAEKGEPFADVLQRQIDKHANDSGANKYNNDLLFIDSNTGEVKHASGGHLIPMNSNDPNAEKHINAVWDLAFDLNEFIKYTFFAGSTETDIQAYLEEIKASQDNKDQERFNIIF